MKKGEGNFQIKDSRYSVGEKGEAGHSEESSSRGFAAWHLLMVGDQENK